MRFFSLLLALIVAGCTNESTSPAPTPTTPAKVAFTSQPTTTVAGAVTLPLAVAVQDASGHTVPTATDFVTVAITSATGTTGAHLRGTKTVSASKGVATFSTLSIDSVGTGYTLTATASGLTEGTSTPFAIVAASAAKLGFTVQPTNATAGVALSPAVLVAVQDSLGNTVPTATNTVTVAITSATGTTGAHLRGTRTVSATTGVATFSALSIDSVGTGYTITATASGFPDRIGSPFDILVAPASKLGFTQQSSVAFVGASTRFRVAIQDSLGNTATGVNGTVTLAIGSNPGSGTLSGTASVPTSSGVATFSTLNIDQAGTGYTLTASLSGVTGATSAAFNVLALSAVSSGLLHNCGRTSDGVAFCWGYNSNGELGNGSTANRSTPVPVSGGLSLASIRAGGNHSCGVTTGGAAYCWGDNLVGELGNGSTTSSSTPVAVAGGLMFAAVSPGLQSHTCGLTIGGAAYCWGFGAQGQLGNDSTSNESTPVAVSGGLNFASVTAGAFHSCGVTTGGAAYCWGSNDSGQLGNGLTTSSSTPVPVSGGLTFAAVSAGSLHTCGVTTGGAVYCWGFNGYGQLGNGTTLRSSSPVPVSGGFSFTSVSAGGLYSCGITTGGAAYCWGNNFEGELGNGATTGVISSNSSTPVAVSGGLAFATLSAGVFQSCAVTTGDAVYCWGFNAYGQLGNGTTSDSNTPVAISSP
jgi:alpha-tubulin suppressor-like RCC1 family protein